MNKAPLAPMPPVIPTSYDRFALEVGLWEASNASTTRTLGGYIAANAAENYERANNKHLIGISFSETYEGLYVDKAINADVHRALYQFLDRFNDVQVREILTAATQALREIGVLEQHEMLKFSRSFVASVRLKR
jgi:hypothetical protein